MPSGVTKQYDLVYSNQGGDWNDFARNWTLAKASIKLLIDELDLKEMPPDVCADIWCITTPCLRSSCGGLVMYFNNYQCISPGIH